jgi:GT2 family glycosyltransferase
MSQEPNNGKQYEMKVPTPCIWVIIPSFNGLAITRNCLTDLVRQTYPNVAIVLSDSGSTDGTREVIPEEFPSVVTVQGDPDWWWTKATNEGVKYALSKSAAGDYIMTLNNDVVIPPHYLAEMVNLAKRYPKSIIGSIIYDAEEPRRLVNCGGYIDWRTMKYHFLEPSDFDQSGFSDKLAFLCGKGVLYPSIVFKQHGLFEETTLPHYGADHDFVAFCKKWGYTLRVQMNVPLYSREDITAAGARDVRTYIGKLKLFFIRKSQVNLGVHLRIMLRHSPRRYWATSAVLLTCRLLGHVFIKNGVQHGPMKVEDFPKEM